MCSIGIELKNSIVKASVQCHSMCVLVTDCSFSGIHSVIHTFTYCYSWLKLERFQNGHRGDFFSASVCLTECFTGYWRKCSNMKNLNILYMMHMPAKPMPVLCWGRDSELQICMGLFFKCSHLHVRAVHTLKSVPVIITVHQMISESRLVVDCKGLPCYLRVTNFSYDLETVAKQQFSLCVATVTNTI